MLDSCGAESLLMLNIISLDIENCAYTMTDFSVFLIIIRLFYDSNFSLRPTGLFQFSFFNRRVCTAALKARMLTQGGFAKINPGVNIRLESRHHVNSLHMVKLLSPPCAAVWSQSERRARQWQQPSRRL